MDETIRIIQAASEDFAIAAQLRRQMAAEMGNDWDRDHPGWSDRFVEYLRHKQETGVAQVFYARSGSDIIGMATVSLIDEYHAYSRGKQAGRVNAVYVSPPCRRRGVARALMLAAIDWLRGKGCIAVRLHSSEGAVPFYQSMGFSPRREMELPL